MRTTTFRPAYVQLLIALCVALGTAPQSAWGAQFTAVTVELTAVAGAHDDHKQATGLPLSLNASAGDGYSLGNCFGSAGSSLSVSGNEDSISASMIVSSAFGGANGCLPISSSGLLQLTATANAPVIRTSVVSSPEYGVLDWSEAEVPRTGDVIHDSAGIDTAHTSFGGSFHVDVLWSIGGPPGSATKPFAPNNASEGVQSFARFTPGDLRYYAPTVDATIQGFDLAGQPFELPGFPTPRDNPFTSFRFPDVPAGADNRFMLKLGDTEIPGLAGETVNLRQYAPDGFSALSLRGDLSPFLTSADPPLTFGLAFAQLGLGGFSLKPVPEPAPFLLLAYGALGWGALRFRRRGLLCALSFSAGLSAAGTPALAQPFYPLTYEARRAAGPITLDGQLDEPAWALADFIDQFSVYQQGTPPAQPILARLLWDDTFLYAGFELDDADLWAIDGHDAYLWESDVAELFLQPTPGASPYYELEVSPKGDVLDLYWLARLTDFEGAKGYESGLEAVVDAHGTIASAAPTDPLHDDVDQGWTLELRVPRAALAPFSASDEWGFLASAADYPRSPGESTLQFTSLLPAPFGFHTYERYERLAFVTEPWIVGDADGDGAVGLSDFGLLKAHFGQPGTRDDGEFTRDRHIDLADFGVLKAHFGNRAAAVPEPTAARLALVGMCASLWVVRRRPGGLRGRIWTPLL